ncbi:succinylglutamate desuccinylase/aspartoacylase family protein [Chondrinema litorale]|uniref:succinylglutamate desuccinylase/aspartoacylase family protein n=1 Tax=Chondrinema litorale TaxID=2994555 RepID=UPI002542F1EB|nr:succinylglutamate desuccinylase/aspartoacylase family protein [Chondrinema litorale]UZR98620.1 succinylglutamate desuccinylase/aspartoacylase family protein [Chondrinema litorale]
MNKLFNLFDMAKAIICFGILFFLPNLSFSQNSESIPHITKIDLENITPGTKNNYWLKISEDGLGQDINIPVVILKGANDGPVLAINAAIHGNELNGIPIIHHIINTVNPAEMNGTIIAIPITNVPAYQDNNRLFPDQTDLNRTMPGKVNGNESQFYAFQLLDKLKGNCDYVIDLHTASFGRINTHYVRADLQDPILAKMAEIQNPQIILNGKAASTANADGTLRSALAANNIKCITIELGNPQVFQEDMKQAGIIGIQNTLAYLKILNIHVAAPKHPVVRCSKSYWIYTDAGGILEVIPVVNQTIEKGQKIAMLYDSFGEVKQTYYAPEKGIVIGKSSNPVSPAGARILHLGIIE